MEEKDNVQIIDFGDSDNTTISWKERWFAVSAYILFFIPIIFDWHKKTRFVSFHVKQGFVLFLLYAIASVSTSVPIANIFSWALFLIGFILFVLGIINSLTGKIKVLPLIGKYAKEINFFK